MVSSSIKNIVRDIIIVAVGVAVIWIGLQVYFGAANPFYVVSSGSMYPELKMYDIIVITGNQPFEDVKVGDIIVFDRPKDHNRVIVHRVVAVVDDDPKTLTTKGDNNQSSIPGTDFPITEKEYTGTVIHVVPQVGYITKILQPPINYIIIVVIVGIMVVKQILKNKNKKELAFSDSDELPPNEKIDDLSNDDEYVWKSKDFVSGEKAHAEELDKENTKSEENIQDLLDKLKKDLDEKKE